MRVFIEKEDSNVEHFLKARQTLIGVFKSLPK
jgi:hypothetical protein